MDGNLYTFAEAEPLVRSLARSLIGKFKRFREDIVQSALLACWQATRDGPADFDIIERAVKKEVAKSIGDLCGRRADDRVTRDSFTDVHYDEMDEEEFEWGVKRRKSLADYDSLPPAEKSFLFLYYYRKFPFDLAISYSRARPAAAKRLVLRFSPLIDDIAKSYLNDE